MDLKVEKPQFVAWTPGGGKSSVVFGEKLWIYGGKTGRADVRDGFGSDVWYMAKCSANC